MKIVTICNTFFFAMLSDEICFIKQAIHWFILGMVEAKNLQCPGRKYPLFYEIFVGTVDGGNDVLQWQETTSTSIKFGLPPGFEKLSELSLHVFVRAISAGGTFEDIKIVIQHK